MRRKKTRQNKPRETRTIDVTIEAIGAQGDGYGNAADGSRVFVGRTVPGDQVRAQVAGQKAASFELISAGPARNDAPCPHYEECGGCALQHVSEEVYRAHKIDMLEGTFRAAGLPVPTIEAIWCPSQSRRRATFKARGRKNGAILGYQKKGSHQLTNIDNCLVLLPELDAALPIVRKLASDILRPGEEASFKLTQFSNGLEVSVELDDDIYEKRRLDFLSALGLAAAAHEFTGITINGEPALRVNEPRTTFGKTSVSPPHDAFLQPSAAGELALTKLVVDNKPARDKGLAVDLFAGCGTYSFPLAGHFDVIAYESDSAQIATIDAGCRTNLVTTVKSVRRDLLLEPLGDLELRKVDYAVLNPPRAGAKEQVLELAKSKVPVVTYVSCNPGTLARDARALLDGGYQLRALTLLDQFIYAAHSECVAVFHRVAQD